MEKENKRKENNEIHRHRFMQRNIKYGMDFLSVI